MNESIKAWENAANADVILKVRQAQIEQLYKQTWVGLVGVFIVAFSVCVVLWQVIPHWKLLAWMGMFSVITAVRGGVTAAFQRRSPSESDVFRWAKLHVIGVSASGLLWALASVFLWPANSPMHQMILPICIVSLSSVAVATYCTWTPSYLAFLLLSTVPLALRLLTEGGFVYAVLGVLALIFIAILLQTGMVMHTASLRALVEGFRNEALNLFLSEEKAKQDELNTQLQREMAERVRSHEVLQVQNTALEKLNLQLTAAKSSLELSNNELEQALANVKQLSGMLPICASCKSIRNDDGYWNQIDEYIRDHSDVQFSHGICPGCIEKLYPQYSGKALKL